MKISIKHLMLIVLYVAIVLGIFQKPLRDLAKHLPDLLAKVDAIPTLSYLDDVFTPVYYLVGFEGVKSIEFKGDNTFVVILCTISMLVLLILFMNAAGWFITFIVTSWVCASNGDWKKVLRTAWIWYTDGKAIRGARPPFFFYFSIASLVWFILCTGTAISLRYAGYE